MPPKAALVKRGTVEVKIDFQDREVLKILGDALQGEDCLGKGLPPYHLGTAPYAGAVALLRIDLPQPTDIAVTGRTHPD